VETPARLGQEPLAEEHRRVARDRIERAALAVLGREGLAATVEDVAAAAGVSERTVFRHYGTRDHMIATALRSQLQHYGDTLPRPDKDGTLDGWLPKLLVEVHRRNAELGRAYWELAAHGESLEGELAEVAVLRQSARTRLVTAVSTTAWRLSGRRGRPPGWLIDVFAIHLSSFATRSLVADFGRDPDEVADASARALLAVLRAP
jgi:AcrR family transcriptional regulator